MVMEGGIWYDEATKNSLERGKGEYLLAVELVQQPSLYIHVEMMGSWERRKNEGFKIPDQAARDVRWLSEKAYWGEKCGGERRVLLGNQLLAG